MTESEFEIADVKIDYDQWVWEPVEVSPIPKINFAPPVKRKIICPHCQKGLQGELLFRKHIRQQNHHEKYEISCDDCDDAITPPKKSAFEKKFMTCFKNLSSTGNKRKRAEKDANKYIKLLTNLSRTQQANRSLKQSRLERHQKAASAITFVEDQETENKMFENRTSKLKSTAYTLDIGRETFKCLDLAKEAVNANTVDP